MKFKKIEKQLKLIVAGLAIIVIVLVSAYFLTVTYLVKKNVDHYQAVFLTSGQAYFGHIVDSNDEYLVLKDIYYLQLKQGLQSGEEMEKEDLSLVKLGNELHGPEDEMKINRDHVIFIENLKTDSQVVMAIKEHKINK